jgi:hypothetical protein
LGVIHVVSGTVLLEWSVAVLVAGLNQG